MRRVVVERTVNTTIYQRWLDIWPLGACDGDLASKPCALMPRTITYISAQRSEFRSIAVPKHQPSLLEYPAPDQTLLPT